MNQVYRAELDSRIITSRKRSFGQDDIFTGVCQSFCPEGEGGLCRMLLPFWLPGPMFLLWGECLSPRGFSLQGGLCERRSLWREVSVKGVSVKDRSLWKGSPCERNADTPTHPAATEVGGTHPTGMHTCYIFIFRQWSTMITKVPSKCSLWTKLLDRSNSCFVPNEATITARWIKSSRVDLCEKILSRSK